MDLIDLINTRRFLGPEFLMWLWFKTDCMDGLMDVENHGKLEVVFDDALTLEAYSPAGDRSLAQRIEARIKRLSKSDKERLAASRDALADFIGSVDDGHRVEDET